MQTYVIHLESGQIHAGFFQKDSLQSTFSGDAPSLIPFLQNHPHDHVLLASSSSEIEQPISELLQTHGISFEKLDFSQLNISFAENLPVSANIIATLYGALRHFPQNDCLVVSLDHEICFDLVTKEGVYRGGATFPSPYAKQKPLSSIGESLSAQNTIGNYYGTLGAIERIIFEIKQEAEHPGSVQVLATSSEPFAEMTQDLQEWVDCIDPHLTLIGLHEIQKEHLLTKEKSL